MSRRVELVLMEAEKADFYVWSSRDPSSEDIHFSTPSLRDELRRG